MRSSIDGVIQKIDTSKLSTDDGDSLDDSADDMSSYSSDTGSGSSNAFITILSTGSYRVKGTVNELNIQNIVEGEPVIVRSRVDSSQIWHGTMGTIDKDSATTNSNSNSFGMMDASGDSQTSSSTYPFYVNLDSSDGLMLGQHVYIENDEGQEDQAGLWLSEVYISDTDTDQPYVWAMGKDKKLEKRSVILGQYDEELGEYEIVDGLTKDDYIAYPAENLKEGMATTKNREEAVESDNVDMEPVSDMSSDELPADDNMDSIDYGYDGTDDTMIRDYDTGDMTDDSEEMTDDWEIDDGSWDDTADMTDGDLPDEDLVPIQDDTEAE